MAHLFRVIRQRPAALASGATLTAAAVAISTFAVLYQGIPTADLELDDGGVWVTNQAESLVGHLNYPSRLLDSAARTTAPAFDVLQDADRVLLFDEAAGTVNPVDTATTTFLGESTLPGGASVALGGATLGVLGGGHLYAVPSDGLAGVSFEKDDALADVGAGAAVTVSRTGAHLFAVSEERSAIVTVDVANGAVSETPLSSLAEDAELSITAVGERPVAFDAKNGVAYLPDGSRVEIPGGAGGVLQQASADGDAVYLATASGLFRLPLGGGAGDVIAEADGEPTAPVQLAGCVYAVWGGSGRYVRDCDGDGDDVDKTLDVPSTSTLTLRTNRRVVVVNDITAGTVWVVSTQVERVDNWDDVVPPPAEDAEEEESEDEQPQFELPERSAENSPPTAVDDAYGVRPGRTTLLRVTENDSDPDGDLLAASLLGDAPAGYTISPVLGGSAFQVAVPANAEGATSFRYQVDDGRGGTDEATVSITVHAADTNQPPVLVKQRTVQVEAGGSVTTTALDGWVDPDGDDLFLQSASVDGGDVVTFRTNGVLEYKAASEVVGLVEVALVVSDGTDTAEGVLRVDVRPPGSLSPVANSDRVTATAGVPVTVSPLLNDISPTGEPLRLSKQDFVAGARITPDYAANTFEFVADAPGAYYVQYLVTVGARSAVGLVRIDVLAGDAAEQDPIAVRDVALLPAGRQVLVDVLANDSDPNGGILVVQSARAAAGVSVEVLEHSVLRVTDLGGLTAPVTVTYTVSNGARSALGEVLIMPVPLPAKLSSPVAVDDTATVRVGDVVTIAVLANDYHPDNDVMRLLPELVDTDIAEGTVFVDGDRIRFQAGSTPGTVHATYQVEDSQLQRDAGYVTIQVIPADQGTNSAPHPKPVTARVVAGNTVRIPIPLDGIDDDGDSVEIVGVASNPAKGRVTVGETWLTYEAYPDAVGTDTFTYSVRDHLGAPAQSTVTVGVAAPGVDNQAPYAVKDTVSVKPGRKVAVPVTVNDSDPDGDDILIVSDGLTVPAGVKAEVASGRVLVTAPNAAGQYTLTYTIADAYGATAQGVLLLDVDPDAPTIAPIARDDRVSALSVGSATSAKVTVLDNDEDPDGTVDELDIEVFDADAVVRANAVEVTLTEAPRIVRYAVTDRDGLTGQAFIFVPGLEGLAPILSTTEPLEVVSGETLTIPLAENVHVRAGRSPRIAVADSVRTSHSNGEPLIADESTLSYTSADGYYGPDTIGVLVTDGSGPDDPEGLSAYVSIPIRVLPATNQSPTVRSATVSVAPGEKGVEVNLTKLSSDPDEGDLAKLSFSIDGDVPDGFTAAISSGVLTVSADADVKPGTTSSLKVAADDGVTEPGIGTITVVAVVSQRPFPVANDDVIDPADQGKSRTVDVLANDFNPFEGEKDLTVVGARVDTTGSGDVTFDAKTVTVTPRADFTGSMIVTYRIADATASQEREVEGRVVLTVRGRPDAPGIPTVVSIQDRTVVLSWAPPANNGAPITSYEVTSSQGYTKSCASTTCTLDGLTNDVSYTFQVVAVNVVGESDPSPASAPARPDARPDTPAPPALVFGDKSLSVSWATPHSAGSPVLSYDLEISPAPATGPIQKSGVTGNSLTWEGLENGVAYQVRVRAVNRAPDPSEWSPYSALVVPAGVPDAPGQPVTVPATPVGAQAQIAVSWAAPANTNGDAVAGYSLFVKRGGSVLQTIPVTGTSQNVTVDTSETAYTFSVTARNKAGDSAPSVDSSPRQAANPPGAPSVALDPLDGAARVHIVPGPLNGNSASQVTYHYRVDQTGAEGVAVDGGTIPGLSNGTSYSVSLWVTSSVQGVAPSAEGHSNAVTPYGKPIITLQSIERLDGAVRFRWNVNANGIYLTGSSGPDGNTSDGDHTWTQTGVAPGAWTNLSVSYTNAAGTTSASWDGQANDPPPAEWSVHVDAANSCVEDGDGGSSHFSNGNCSSAWAPANSYQVATCWAEWTSKNTKGDYRWFRLKSAPGGLAGTWYLSVYTTVGEAIPAGMPKC